eukprot:scaffold174149_cov22-Tisochrysis_lutea.AAC.3
MYAVKTLPSHRWREWRQHCLPACPFYLLFLNDVRSIFTAYMYRHIQEYTCACLFLAKWLAAALSSNKKKSVSFQEGLSLYWFIVCIDTAAQGTIQISYGWWDPQLSVCGKPGMESTKSAVLPCSGYRFQKQRQPPMKMADCKPVSAGACYTFQNCCACMTDVCLSGCQAMCAMLLPAQLTASITGAISLGEGVSFTFVVAAAAALLVVKAMRAMNRMSAVCVPLYETLGENAIEYIIQHSGAKMVISQDMVTVSLIGGGDHFTGLLQGQAGHFFKCQLCMCVCMSVRACIHVYVSACAQAFVHRGSKLAAVAKALARGAKDVVTSGVVYWGKADPKDVE